MKEKEMKMKSAGPGSGGGSGKAESFAKKKSKMDSLMAAGDDAINKSISINSTASETSKTASRFVSPGRTEDAAGSSAKPENTIDSGSTMVGKGTDLMSASLARRIFMALVVATAKCFHVIKPQKMKIG